MIDLLGYASEGISKLTRGRICGKRFESAGLIKGLAFSDDDILKDLSVRYGFEGDLAQIYVQGSAKLVHKWHHYLPI